MILSSKRIKELETENEELKKLLQSFSAKEEKLKRFDELIKKARIEYGDITQRKDQTAQTLELLENEKTKLNHEIQKISYEIKQLRELKIDEHNQLLTLNNALLDSGKISHDDKVNQLSGTKFNLYEEIDAAEKRKNKLKNETLELEKKYKETYQKIQEIKDVEQTLRTKIEKRKEELSIIIESHNAILEEQRENVNSRFGGLNDEEKKISDEVRLRADKLSEEEIAKKRIISELEDKISNKKTQLESLTGDYKTKTALLNEASDKNKQLLEEIEIKTKQLYELNESIEIATAELTDLDYGLNILGDEFKNLSKEFQDTKSTKDEIYSTLKEGAKEKKELEGYLKELRETTTILAQLKNDIEQGSGMSAKRFAGVLKYYSTYISEMYKQKIHLEKILDKKEKDVEEKDKLLYEKQSALNEIDKVMFIGQDTAELFQELIRKIQKQWEQIKNIVSFSETKGFSQIIQNKETLTENDPTDKKLSEFENTLKEMLKKSENYFNKYDEKRPVFKNEKREYGQRLNELNKNIRDSVNELSNLHSSINKIKEEHEEHRQDINKLVSMKKRLEEEISKYKVTIDKYEKIKQKILKEQEMIRGKKGIKEQKDQVTKHDESEKIPNPDNYNWVKT
jgi:chromosome segregation ATPase